MWLVYFQFGFHEIRHCTEEEFEKVKKFYHLFEGEKGEYRNKRGDIHAWRNESGTKST